jgi:Lipocalin-like domain
MKRLIILTACAVTAFGLFSGAAFSQQKSLKEQVVGSWTYVSAETIAPDGKRTPTFGSNPAGMWIFGSDGRFMSLVMRNDIPKFSSNNRATGTSEENKAVVQGGIATFGHYSIDEAGRTLVLNIERSSFPNWNGTQQRRPITISGDELKYIVPEASAGGGRAEVVLRRAK